MELTPFVRRKVFLSFISYQGRLAKLNITGCILNGKNFYTIIDLLQALNSHINVDQ